MMHVSMQTSSYIQNICYIWLVAQYLLASISLAWT
ncbi:hypothetical protein CR513_25918 [Mucuna pruriens]|uniref:Uncharacterized protein n=1 Tax=Mucuna pruriens TaxID=157652 RepID=A0A371GN93_MUCPR|nr:hypothetical protein CR513_25918 [Mucuna pruriens]